MQLSVISYCCDCAGKAENPTSSHSSNGVRKVGNLDLDNMLHEGSELKKKRPVRGRLLCFRIVSDYREVESLSSLSIMIRPQCSQTIIFLRKRISD